MALEFEKVVLADGRAVLYRGDSLELLAAGLLTPCAAIVSDPPYGIGFQHGGCNLGNVQSSRATIVGDDKPFDPLPWIAQAPCTHYQKTNELKGIGGQPKIILWGASNYMQALPPGGTLLAWDKHIGVAGDDSFADCEWAWCGRRVKREVFRHLWKGAVASKSDLDASPNFPRTKGGKPPRLHISQKPAALMRWCIQKVRPAIDGIILDPYMGSGTTGIAALSLGYRFTGVEIDPGHFATACARIEAWWAEHGVDA